MNLLEAVGLMQSGHRCRPTCWHGRIGRKDHWVECCSWRNGNVTVMADQGPGLPPRATYACLETLEELGGPWELVPEAAQVPVAQEVA